VDLKLNPITWDVAVPIEWITGIDETVQRIQVRLGMQTGEWFKDANVGMPYFQRILEKGVIPAIVRNLVRECVLSTPGVVDVVNIDASINAQTRTCSVSNLRIKYGPEGSIANVPDFIVGARS